MAKVETNSSKMADTENNYPAPPRKMLIDAFNSLKKFFMEGLEELIRTGLKEEAQAVTHRGVRTASRTLHIPEDVIVFVLIGNNMFRPSWGSLADHSPLPPLRDALKTEVIDIGKKICSEKNYYLRFNDATREGNLQMHITFQEKRPTIQKVEEVKEETPAKSETDKPTTSKWKKAVISPGFNHSKFEELVEKVEALTKELAELKSKIGGGAEASA